MRFSESAFTDRRAGVPHFCTYVYDTKHSLIEPLTFLYYTPLPHLFELFREFDDAMAATHSILHYCECVMVVSVRYDPRRISFPARIFQQDCDNAPVEVQEGGPD